jgi:hypothetical protein
MGEARTQFPGMTMKTLSLALLLVGAIAASPSVAADRTGEDGFATRSVTGMGLTGEPSRTGQDNGAGAAVGTGANAGVVGGGAGSGSVGTGSGPGTPQPGGGTFGTPRGR